MGYQMMLDDQTPWDFHVCSAVDTVQTFADLHLLIFCNKLFQTWAKLVKKEVVRERTSFDLKELQTLSRVWVHEL